VQSKERVLVRQAATLALRAGVVVLVILICVIHFAR
jgi:hypothetical protein